MPKNRSSNYPKVTNAMTYLKEETQKELTPEQYLELEPKLNQLEKTLIEYEKAKDLLEKKKTNCKKVAIIMGGVMVAYLTVGSFLMRCGVDIKNPIISNCIRGYGALINIVGVGTIIPVTATINYEMQDLEEIIDTLTNQKEELIEDLNLTKKRILALTKKES